MPWCSDLYPHPFAKSGVQNIGDPKLETGSRLHTSMIQQLHLIYSSNGKNNVSQVNDNIKILKGFNNGTTIQCLWTKQVTQNSATSGLHSKIWAQQELTICNQVTRSQLHSCALSCPEPRVQCSLVCRTKSYHHITYTNITLTSPLMKCGDFFIPSCKIH